MTGLCLIDVVEFYFLRIILVEGISLEARCFDGGIRNIRVGCDRFFSKSVSMLIAYNTCMGFDFVEKNGGW